MDVVRNERIVTDNVACFRAGTFTRALLGARHQRITPRHNGKVERYNRIIAEEFLYTRSRLSEDQRRDTLDIWNIHYFFPIYTGQTIPRDAWQARMWLGSWV